MMLVYIMAYISIPASHIKVKDKAAQDLDYKHDSTLYKERYLSQREHSTAQISIYRAWQPYHH